LTEAGLIAARFLHFATVMTPFGLALVPVYSYPNRAGDAAHLGWKLAATHADISL
jgi:hypothetical protein